MMVTTKLVLRANCEVRKWCSLTGINEEVSHGSYTARMPQQRGFGQGLSLSEPSALLSDLLCDPAG